MKSADRQNSKCSMGVEGLDDILGGGLPRNRIYLVQGDPGVGKTTLALHICWKGCAWAKPVFTSPCQKPRRNWKWSLNPRLDLEKIHLFELASIEENLQGETESTFFHPSEVALNRTAKALLDEVIRVKPMRVVFDSLSEMRMLAETSPALSPADFAAETIFCREEMHGSAAGRPFGRCA